jgi:hypothetical protein
MRFEELLQAMGSVLEPHSACYVAGPIAGGGPTLFPARPNDRARQEHENRIRLAESASSLRSILPIPVIDPGLLVVSGWEGEDYSRFFLEVIARFVKEIRFLDGWEYSLGATKEFVFGRRRGIDCLTFQGEQISLEMGQAAILNARADCMDAGDLYRAEKLSVRVADLQRGS